MQQATRDPGLRQRGQGGLRRQASHHREWLERASQCDDLVHRRLQHARARESNRSPTPPTAPAQESTTSWPARPISPDRTSRCPATNTPPPSSDAAETTPGTCPWFSAPSRSPTTSTPLTTLVLDAPTLAKIFNGSITRWDDPAITALNTSMPPENIHVVYREDPSGTTAHFQAYLQAASGGAWDKGTGKIFTGGVGTGAHGQPRHLGGSEEHRGRDQLQRIFVRLQQNLSPPRSKPRQAVNRCARCASAPTRSARPSPTPRSSARATTSCSTFPGSTTQAQPDVYPIVMVTYEIVCSKYPSPDVAQAVKAFLQAAVGPGQADLDKHGYIPLPPDFQVARLRRHRRHRPRRR